MGDKTKSTPKKEPSKHKWVYEYEAGEKYRRTYTNKAGEVIPMDVSSVRYVLGEIFLKEEKPKEEKEKKVLVCIGVNPSTAIPGILDPTLKRVQKYASDYKYDEWYMLNLFPLRATNPNDLPEDKEYKKYKDVCTKNIEVIRKLLKEIPQADVWCAWGATMNSPKYSYLRTCCKEILKLFSGDGYTFKAYDQTADGYPSHPLLRQKRNDELSKKFGKELGELSKPNEEKGTIKFCLD